MNGVQENIKQPALHRNGRNTPWFKKTGLLVYFLIPSTNTDQYPQFLVERISLFED